MVARKAPATSHFLFEIASSQRIYFTRHHLAPLLSSKGFLSYLEIQLTLHFLYPFIGSFPCPIAESLWAIFKLTINKAATIPTPLESEKNIPPIATEMNLSAMNNEQMVKYVKKLQATLEQYKTREEAS